MSIHRIKRKLTKALTTPSRLGWEVTREAGASVLTYELYPLGLVGKSVPTVPLLTRKEATREFPILFIHGIFHNRSAFAWMKQRLYLRGFQKFKEMDLWTSLYPLSHLAEQVAHEVTALLKLHRSPQLDIVAHSMGGLIARYYVQKLGGDGLVRNLITLGTPHQGTEWSRFSVLPHIRELRPNSRTIRVLNQCAPPLHTRACAVSGSLDVMMRPSQCTYWPGVRNIRLKGVGHAGLLFSNRVFQILACHLEEQLPTDELSRQEFSYQSAKRKVESFADDGKRLR